MISALQRLKAEQGIPDQMPDQMLAFGINSHLKDGLMRMLSTHPPLDDRIAALMQRSR